MTTRPYSTARYRWNGATGCAVLGRFFLLSGHSGPVTGQDDDDAAAHPFPTAGTARQAAPFWGGFFSYRVILSLWHTQLRANAVRHICPRKAAAKLQNPAPQLHAPIYPKEYRSGGASPGRGPVTGPDNDDAAIRHRSIPLERRDGLRRYGEVFSPIGSF